MERNGKSVICGVAVSFFLLSFMTMLVFAFSFLLRDKKESDDFKEYLGKYKYLKFDETTKESSFGIASLFVDPQEISDSFFTSYSHEGNSYLISSFGLNEYSCTGSCSCGEERRVVGSKSVFARSVLYLVAATTSVLAYRLSEEYFKEECFEMFQNGDLNCPSTSILSEVESCEKVVNRGHEGEEGGGVSKDHFQGFKHYICEGNCLPNDKLKSVKSSQEADEFRCERIEMIEKLTIPVRKKLDLETINNGALFEFYNILDGHCRFSSKAVQQQGSLYKGSGRMGMMTNLCMSGEFGKNPSVTCTVIKEYEMTSEDWVNYDKWKKEKKDK